MKKNQIIVATIFVSLVLGMLIRQSGRKFELYKSSIYGETISVIKGLKGYNDIIIIQKNKLRHIDFKLANNSLLIASGDSLYKDGNSDVFYIKKKAMSTFMKLEIVDAQIGRKWE